MKHAGLTHDHVNCEQPEPDLRLGEYECRRLVPDHKGEDAYHL
jgi:hypothetical protein